MVSPAHLLIIVHISGKTMTVYPLITEFEQRTHSIQSRALARKQVERSILLQVNGSSWKGGLEKVRQDNSRPSQRPTRHDPERKRREIGFLRCRRTASLPAGGQRQRRGAGGLI